MTWGMVNTRRSLLYMTCMAQEGGEEHVRTGHTEACHRRNAYVNTNFVVVQGYRLEVGEALEFVLDDALTELAANKTLQQLHRVLVVGPFLRQCHGTTSQTAPEVQGTMAAARAASPIRPRTKVTAASQANRSLPWKETMELRTRKCG